MYTFPGETYHGKIPTGCTLCAQGAKLVLFMTGACLDNCYYCPLSSHRKGSWHKWANERRVIDKEDVLAEARAMQALGTGITGGDPLLVSDETIEYATLLKDTFSESHHIHLYTSGTLADRTVLGYLEPVIDEIRFHPQNGAWDKVSLAMSFDMDVGAEIPVIPGHREEILSLAAYLDDIGAQFLNLNELEYSETNSAALRRLGMSFSSSSNAVMGSEELALSLVNETKDLDLSVHYCSSRFKDGVQLRERLKRRAQTEAKKYEDIDEDGLLVRGEIEAGTPERRDGVLSVIQESFERDDDMVEVQGTKILTSWAAAQELREMIEDTDIVFTIVKEYPLYERIVVEKEIL
ncbi:MAG: radical SAM protein [Candidatus Methanofastidiosa archaeon]|nr:radical SAM protein [Candidatus Methanofastidiosa archaeon]